MRHVTSVLTALYQARLHGVLRLLQLNILVAAANFMTAILLARALGAEGRGQVAILAMWVGITAYVALGGAHLFLARKAGSEPDAASAIYARVIGIVGMTCVPSFAVFAAVALTVTRLTTPGIAPIAWIIAAATVPLGVWNAMQMQIELGRGRLGTYVATQIIFVAGQVGLVGLLWIAGRHQPFEYVLATLTASASACFITHWSIRRGLCTANDRMPLPSPPRIMLAARKDALAVWLVLLAGLADRLVVSLTFPARIFGVYVVVLALAHLQNLAVEAMAPLFFARSARDHGAGTAEYDQLAERLRQTIVVNAAAAVALLVTAPVVLPLVFGPEYADGLGLVYFMVPAAAMKAMMRPYEEVLRGTDCAMQQSAASVAMVVVFALGAVLAVHFAWLEGVALSLLAASLTGLVLVVRAVSIKTGLAAVTLFLPQAHDVTALLAECRLHARKIAYGR